MGMAQKESPYTYPLFSNLGLLGRDLNDAAMPATTRVQARHAAEGQPGVPAQQPILSPEQQINAADSELAVLTEHRFLLVDLVDAADALTMSDMAIERHGPCPEPKQQRQADFG